MSLNLVQARQKDMKVEETCQFFPHFSTGMQFDLQRKTIKNLKL
jgi:hypothetical protein